MGISRRRGHRDKLRSKRSRAAALRDAAPFKISAHRSVRVYARQQARCAPRRPFASILGRRRFEQAVEIVGALLRARRAGEQVARHCVDCAASRVVVARIHERVAVRRPPREGRFLAAAGRSHYFVTRARRPASTTLPPASPSVNYTLPSVTYASRPSVSRGRPAGLDLLGKLELYEASSAVRRCKRP